MERKFDYKSLVVGDIVKTSYGFGKVVDKHGEMYIEFDDGSGASLHEATLKCSRLQEVLIRQVGDTRECPCCRKSFIPRDRTSEMAREMYKELFG